MPIRYSTKLPAFFPYDLTALDKETFMAVIELQSHPRQPFSWGRGQQLDKVLALTLTPGFVQLGLHVHSLLLIKFLKIPEEIKGKGKLTWKSEHATEGRKNRNKNVFQISLSKLSKPRCHGKGRLTNDKTISSQTNDKIISFGEWYWTPRIYFIN